MMKKIVSVFVVSALMAAGILGLVSNGSVKGVSTRAVAPSIVNVTSDGMDNGIIKVDISSGGGLPDLHKNINGTWKSLNIFSESVSVYYPYGAAGGDIYINWNSGREVVQNNSDVGIVKYSGNVTISEQSVHWERYFILKAGDEYITTKLVLKNNGNQTLQNLGFYEYMDFDLAGSGGDHVFVPLKNGTQQIHIETKFNGSDFADNWIYQRDDNIATYPYAQAGLLTSAPDTIENFWVARWGGGGPPTYGISGDSITTGDIIWGVGWKTNLEAGAEASFYYGLAAPDSIDDLIDMSNRFTTEGLYTRLTAPGEACQGDRILVSANITNYFNISKTMNIQLTLPSGFTAVTSLSRSINIGAGQSDTVFWVVDISTASSVIGYKTLQASASTGTDRGLIFHNSSATVHVVPDGILCKETRAGLLRNTDFNSSQIILPENTIYAEGEAVMYPSVELVFIDEVKFLIGYPYGCMEQRGSRLLADIEIYYYLHTAGKLTIELRTQLEQDIVGGALDIIDLQHNDRGWGWYPTYSSTPFFTNYALLTLLKTKAWATRYGMYIPPSDNGRNFDTYVTYGLKWLVDHRNPDGSWTGTSPDYIQDKVPLTAYNLWVLAKAQSLFYTVANLSTAITNATNWLKSAQNADGGWGKSANDAASDTFPTALAIMALREAGELATAQYLQNGRTWLLNHKVTIDSKYYWSSSLTYSWFAHVPETTSFVIIALLKTGSANTDANVTKALDYLLDNSDAWLHGSTKDGATTVWMFNELGLIPSTVNTRVVLRVNAQEACNVSFVGANLAPRTVDITGNLTITGTNTFNISSTGTGDVAYTITVRYWVPYGTATRSASVQLNWGNWLTKQVVTTELDPGNFTVNVSLEFTPTVELRYVIIDDYIPAGFTLVTASLPTDIACEISGERISFVPQVVTTGGLTITYQMLASQISISNMNIRPARAAAMYEPWLCTVSNKPTLSIGAIIPIITTVVTVDGKEVNITGIWTGTINVNSTALPHAIPENLQYIICINVTATGTLTYANITVKYNNDDIAGTDESKLRMYYWDDSQWRLCSNTSVDTLNNIVWANVTHLTIFAPMAEKVAGAAGAAEEGINWLLYTGIGVIAIVIIITVGLIGMRRKRRGEMPMHPPSPPNL